MTITNIMELYPANRTLSIEELEKESKRLDEELKMARLEEEIRRKRQELDRIKSGPGKHYYLVTNTASGRAFVTQEMEDRWKQEAWDKTYTVLFGQIDPRGR